MSDFDYRGWLTGLVAMALLRRPDIEVAPGAAPDFAATVEAIVSALIGENDDSCEG